MDDATITRVLAQDFSVGAEEFREDLLPRCLSMLSELEELAVLDDDALESLSAAGDVLANGLTLHIS